MTNRVLRVQETECFVRAASGESMGRLIRAQATKSFGYQIGYQISYNIDHKIGYHISVLMECIQG